MLLLVLGLGVLGSGVLGPPAAVADPRLPTPAGWPLPGAPGVLHGFDAPAQRWLPGHRGVDLAGRVGEPVLSAAAGTVAFAGLVAGEPVVVVDHGSVHTTYEPVRATVPRGSPVHAGEEIGVLTAGTHCGRTVCLHWGLYAEGSGGARDYLDPLQLIPVVGAAGPVRLLPASAAAAADRRARARALAAVASAVLGAGAGPVLGAAGAHGFRFPMHGPITSPFGMRFHPVLHVWKLHDGTDFGAACGTAIAAPYPGVVTARLYNRGYGNRLMLDHGMVDGHHVVTGYNHATDYLVPVGARVGQGQVIGHVGETGFATGCHLHLMVWIDGHLVNPMTWF